LLNIKQVLAVSFELPTPNVQGNLNHFHLGYHTLKFKENHLRNRLSHDLTEITSPASFRKL